MLQTLLANVPERIRELLFTGMHVLFIAVIFEGLAWWLGRRIERATSGFLNADAGRDSAWRLKRRAMLSRVPKLAARALCYSVALILVFDRFGVPVMALSLSLGAVALLFGAALVPQMRDAAQGYALLTEDALAVGDVIEVNGHAGIVEKWTLRGVWLRDRDNKLHLLSHRDLSSFVVHARRLEKSAPALDASSTNATATNTASASAKPTTAARPQVAFDPLAQPSNGTSKETASSSTTNK